MEKAFGRELRAIREERGWTLEDMAKHLNTTKQALSRYERGERTPKITIAAKFAEALNVPLETLLGEEPPDQPVQPQTEEAKILSRGIDKLPKEQREQALAMFRVMFAPQFADLFTKERNDET